ncbi:MAG: M1 family aminopeptidase [Bacteroidota bacterium]
MRILLVLLFSFIAVVMQAQSKIDILHYKFSIELNDNNDSIYGKAEIKFAAKKGTNSLALDLSGDMFGKKKGMHVTKATVPYKNPNNSDTPNPGTTHINDKLVITFWSELSSDDTLLAIIDYKGIPSDGLIISKNKYGNRTFFSDNWPNRAHYWIPCIDDPADKASVEFIVTAPSHYQVVSNGVQIEETNLPGNKKLTHYKEDVVLPTKVMVIGVADFAVSTVGNVDCIPVSSWVYPENKTEGFYDYAMAKDILAYHINYIGPYAYQKLANVQSKTKFGGMENAGAIFYAEYSVTGERMEEELLSHEIVHQWFGDMATEKSFAHFWLSEGFATYLTHMYIESKYGIDSLNKEMRDDRDKVIEFVKRSHRPVVDQTKDYMQLLNANSYQKGSWVLHMLRRQLGDSVFHQGIRLYYTTYAGKNADSKDFQQVFERVSGKDLAQFFQQWLYTPENPSLDMTWKYDVAKKELSLHVKQLQSTNFQFPLNISMIAASGARTSNRIEINKKEADYHFSFPEKPTHLTADDFVSVLFEAKITELK